MIRSTAAAAAAAAVASSSSSMPSPLWQADVAEDNSGSGSSRKLPSIASLLGQSRGPLDKPSSQPPQLERSLPLQSSSSATQDSTSHCRSTAEHTVQSSHQPSPVLAPTLSSSSSRQSPTLPRNWLPSPSTASASTSRKRSLEDAELSDGSSSSSQVLPGIKDLLLQGRPPSPSYERKSSRQISPIRGESAPYFPTGTSRPTVARVASHASSDAQQECQKLLEVFHHLRYANRTRGIVPPRGDQVPPPHYYDAGDHAAIAAYVDDELGAVAAREGVDVASRVAEGYNLRYPPEQRRMALQRQQHHHSNHHQHQDNVRVGRDHRPASVSPNFHSDMIAVNHAGPGLPHRLSYDDGNARLPPAYLGVTSGPPRPMGSTPTSPNPPALSGSWPPSVLSPSVSPGVPTASQGPLASQQSQAPAMHGEPSRYEHWSHHHEQDQRRPESYPHGMMMPYPGHVDPTGSNQDLIKAAPARRSKAKRRVTKREGEVPSCLACGRLSTAEWRRGPTGPRTLCNACGLLFAKMSRIRRSTISSSSTSSSTGSSYDTASMDQAGGADPTLEELRVAVGTSSKSAALVEMENERVSPQHHHHHHSGAASGGITPPPSAGPPSSRPYAGLPSFASHRYDQQYHQHHHQQYPPPPLRSAEASSSSGSHLHRSQSFPDRPNRPLMLHGSYSARATAFEASSLRRITTDERRAQQDGPSLSPTLPPTPASAPVLSVGGRNLHREHLYHSSASSSSAPSTPA